MLQDEPWRPVWFRMLPRVRRWPKSLRFDDVPVPVLLPEPLAGDVRTLLHDGRHVEAVALVRQRTHLDLFPAVEAVDALAAEEERRDGEPGPGR